jgi:transposase
LRQGGHDEQSTFQRRFQTGCGGADHRRGYPVAEVSQRLGVSQHSLYAWKKKFSQPSGGNDKDVEIRQLKRELARVTEERDILKKATAYFARDAK